MTGVEGLVDLTWTLPLTLLPKILAPSISLGTRKVSQSEIESHVQTRTIAAAGDARHAIDHGVTQIHNWYFIFLSISMKIHINSTAFQNIL